LRANLVNPGAAGTFSLLWEFTSPSGKKYEFKSSSQRSSPVPGAAVPFQVPYVLSELCSAAYTEYRGKLAVLNEQGKEVGATELWFGTWTVPIDLDLGGLYLRPEQKQFVRLNLGLSAAAMKTLATVRLEVVRRSTGELLRSQDIPAHPAAVAQQRGKIPGGMRDDFTNLLLADLDVSFLPVQPFANPERNWFIRASARDNKGKIVATVDSPPFCRQAHEPAQPPIRSVAIKNNMVLVNDQPWMPWGVVYGHVPVYDGPADPGPGKYLDLHNLPAYSIYDRFSAAGYTRAVNDFNCLRYIAGSISDPKALDKSWQKDNVYASSAFVAPQPVLSVAELVKAAGGADKLQANLAFHKSAPMVVSLAPGIEEAFGLFHGLNAGQLKGLEEVVTYLRKATGKPVMVGHGGYWNRLEFEKAPFFDIYDPETEPLYPGNLHTDLKPILKGKDKVFWLRPQMYEDVPYERWRFHVFVELMRGCRGWQIAHGPGDPSLFRGLHGELEFFKPIIASTEAAPKVQVQPLLEHWVGRHKGRTYLIAATTRGLGLGRWHWSGEAPGKAPGRRFRITRDPSLVLNETNSYGADQPVDRGPAFHGVQYLPHARSWPAGTKLVQWVRLDGKATPANLVILAKTEGRWIHGASWGKFDPVPWSKDPVKAAWFLRGFYRHAYGFLGWGLERLEQSRAHILSKTAPMGAMPEAGQWVRLEVPLDKIGAVDRLLDGVAFAHEGGVVHWGQTSLITPDDKETILWGDALEHPAEELARTKIEVAGLKGGTRVRVLFEDRELKAEDGFFTDDFRGQDLYQRYGGGYGVGYGNGPVALHLYEITGP
jgi:hypothetical protein